YFTELLSDSKVASQADGSDNGRGAAAPVIAQGTQAQTPAKIAESAPTKAAVAPAPERKSETAPPVAEPHAQAEPIRGAALKIVENMEASLAVPTATSQRRIPVKLLDKNRRIINQHLSQNFDREGGRKASYTHLIAWAILRALDKFPQLNDGFEAIDGQPARVKRESVNLGLAIDLEKKDGTRTLLVPNIKNANQLSFSDFLAAYDDTVRRAREGKLQVADFQATTVTLTNPGTIGT